MEGQNIVFNDGTVIPGRVGYADGFLWLWFTGYTIQQAANIFFDPAKTSRIVFQYGDMEDVYEGFTNCISIGVSVDGQASVCMVKGV